MTIALNLYDNVKRSDAGTAYLGDGESGTLRNWRRSIQSVGGYWLGTGDYNGSRAAMLEIYLEGVARRIVETAGGKTTWEGFIARMDLTLNGVTYVRALLPCANAVRCIYSQIGDNLFSDGSVETAAWTAVSTPSTHERITTWATRGTYGMHVVTDAGAEGTQIESGIAVVASTGYQCRVTVEVVTGTWTLAIHRSDNDVVLGQRSTDGAGKDVLIAYVNDANDYAGNVYVRITADATGAEMYADAAVLQTSPVRAETEWTTDANAAAEYGRIEDILLEAGMTDDAAEAKVAKDCTRRAWPRSLPPERFATRATGKQDGLSIMFAGYVWTLNWLHLLAGGTGAASAHVTSLVNESEFVTAGVVDTNNLDYQVEETEPMRLWDALENIIRAGDGTGARWVGGVYAGRKFNYLAASTSLDYHYRGGRLLSVHGSPVEPWAALPGLARLDDAPVGPGQITGETADDPRNVWIEEVSFQAPDILSFRRDRLAQEGRG